MRAGFLVASGERSKRAADHLPRTRRQRRVADAGEAACGASTRRELSLITGQTGKVRIDNRGAACALDGAAESLATEIAGLGCRPDFVVVAAAHDSHLK